MHQLHPRRLKAQYLGLAEYIRLSYTAGPIHRYTVPGPTTTFKLAHRRVHIRGLASRDAAAVSEASSSSSHSPPPTRTGRARRSETFDGWSRAHLETHIGLGRRVQNLAGAHLTFTYKCTGSLSLRPRVRVREFTNLARSSTSHHDPTLCRAPCRLSFVLGRSRRRSLVTHP